MIQAAKSPTTRSALFAAGAGVADHRAPALNGRSSPGGPLVYAPSTRGVAQFTKLLYQRRTGSLSPRVGEALSLKLVSDRKHRRIVSGACELKCSLDGGELTGHPSSLGSI